MADAANQAQIAEAPAPSAKRRKKLNIWVTGGAVLAVALTAAGLGVGLSQTSVTTTAAAQQPSFITVSGPGQLSDSSSYVSGGLEYPQTLPLKTVGSNAKFLTPSYYTGTNGEPLNPLPEYTVLTTNAGSNGSGLAANSKLSLHNLTRMRAGESFDAAYTVVTAESGKTATQYVLHVSYTVQARKLAKGSQALYDTTTFLFDTSADKQATTLPIIDVLDPTSTAGAPVYITPTYKDEAGKAITTKEQVAALPNGKSFTATYAKGEYVLNVTYVVNVKG